MPDVLRVVRDGGTERPHTGQLETGCGTYVCRRCGLAVFASAAKFESGCGWPSFDEALEGVERLPDADGRRIEIRCRRCGGHLGHVFQGEGFTHKDTRHCVNAASLDFVPSEDVVEVAQAIFAAGCFWGVEAMFMQKKGVLRVESGYTGGHVQAPTYEAVCTGKTGHYEAVRVLYDPSVLDYEALARYFFEIHDPTQHQGQGPDHGSQYLSAAFYLDETQKAVLLGLMEQLKQKGYAVVTRVLPATVFWPAEAYHQNYYAKTGKAPYCHTYKKRF